MRISTLLCRPVPTTLRCCDEALAHCHETLVLHADGTVECDGADACGLEEPQHELWVACDELGCGCAGDDAPMPALLAA